MRNSEGSLFRHTYWERAGASRRAVAALLWERDFRDEKRHSSPCEARARSPSPKSQALIPQAQTRISNVIPKGVLRGSRAENPERKAIQNATGKGERERERVFQWKGLLGERATFKEPSLRKGLPSKEGRPERPSISLAWHPDVAAAARTKDLEHHFCSSGGAYMSGQGSR